MTKVNSMWVVVVLDRSGSMTSVRDATIAGFNEFLNGQRNVPGECRISLVQFDDVYEKVYVDRPVVEAPFLTRETYVPRNNTALLDAIGRTIVETGNLLEARAEGERPAKVIIVIQTDGYENASREFDKTKIQDMIKHQRDKYGWDFLFLSAGQDAIMSAAQYGIAAGAAMNYNSSQKGSERMFASLNSSIVRTRYAGVTGQSINTEFTEEERTENSKKD